MTGKQLPPKGKRQKKQRRAQDRPVLHSTVAGWWSLSPRAALRMGSTWRYRQGSDGLSSAHSLLFLWVLVGCARLICIWFILQFGIEDLKALPDQTSCWDGVRNYQVGPQNWLKFFPLLSVVNVPLNYLSSAGAQFYEADERRAAGFLLPQQLQGPGDSGSHESNHSLPLMMIFLWFKQSCRHDIQLFPSLDCEGSLRGPHSVWQERRPFWRKQ